MPTSKLRLLPALLLLCLLLAPALAEVSPTRILLLRGAIALDEGPAARAVSDLGDAAAMYPEDWRCQFLYGHALLQAGEREQARAQFRRATLLAPLNPEPWQALMRVAREMNDVHLEIAAIAGLQRLVPDDPQLLRRLAEIYRAAGQKAEADRLDAQWQAILPPLKLDYRFLVGARNANLFELRQLTKEDPDNKAILYALATEEWRANHLPEAREAMRKLYVATPANPEVVSDYAHLCLLTGEVEPGLDALRQAGQQGTFAMDRTLALWSLSGGQYQQALEPLDRLLQRSMIDAASNRLMGFAQMMAGNPGAACAAYRIAWLREHDHLSAQQYAAALQANGAPEEAEAILKRGRELAPAETALGLQLSLLYRDTDRLSECAQLTAELAKTRPETVELYLLAGERFFRAGFIGQAYQIAVTLRDRYPKDLVATLGAVSLFHRLAVRDEARLTLTRYLGPNFPAPMSTTELLLLVAQYAADDNKLTDAVMALEETIKKVPNCREAYLQLGKLHQQQGNWNEAIRAYNRALALWPNDPEFSLALARVAWQAGNYPLAMALYRQLAAGMPTADALLELGTLYYRQGDEARAKECWETAKDRRGGQVRARLSLLSGYEREGDTDNAAKMRNELLTILNVERTTRAARWRTEIAAAGLTATDDEIDALLLLDPDLTDPAPLLVKPQPKPAPPVTPPAPPEPTAAPEPPAAPAPPAAPPTQPVPPAEPAPPATPEPVVTPEPPAAPPTQPVPPTEPKPAAQPAAPAVTPEPPAVQPAPPAVQPEQPAAPPAQPAPPAAQPAQPEPPAAPQENPAPAPEPPAPADQ